MAKTFTSGTKSGLANAAAVGQAMAEQIRDDLVTHAAWELVEEVTPGTIHWYVLRNLSSVSGLPNDFYVIIERVIATGKLTFYMCEGYDSGTNVMSLYPTQTSSASSTNTYTYDSNGRQTSHTFTLSTTAITSSVNQPRGHIWTPSGTSTNYWIIAKDDGFTVAFDGASDAVVHCGAFVWLGSTPNAMPIHMFGTNSPTGSFGYITRNPLCISGSFGGFAMSLDPMPGSAVNADLFIGFPGRLDIADALQSGLGPTSEIGQRISSNASAGHVNGTNVIGDFIGKCKDVRFGRQPLSAAFGDAYEMDGTLWVPAFYGITSINAGILYDTGVPA